MQANKMNASGGREASRERRTQLGQGKGSLPTAGERSRIAKRDAGAGVQSAPVSMPAPVVNVAPAPAKLETVVAPASTTSGTTLGGRDASRARRSGLVQGKTGLSASQTTTAAPASAEYSTPNAGTPIQNGGRGVAQAFRATRAKNGRNETAAVRPSGRMRPQTPISYPPKVADTETYAGKKVTGVRIGRGRNMTGDEAGVDVQVTGSQYIGKETGFNPREGGVKVGAARTAAGLVVTGTQVRSKIMITGDESNSGIRITGEADQEIADDLLNRREQGGTASMQFQRQNNPHGHTVFGTNLGRSIKSIGSRDRDTTRATEQTDGGLPISGTAVGRSVRVTGDEHGSCRPISGDQYLMPGNKQPLCKVPGSKPVARAGSVMGRAANGGERPDPVTGEKVVVSETWTRQRISGVDVEYNINVSGDEYGVCAPITGTPYAGPGQYEAFCETGDASMAAQRVAPGQSTGNRVTGDAARNVENVSGTQRGAQRELTGTVYYRAEPEAVMQSDAISHLNSRFSVRSPQREAQLQKDAKAVEAPSAEACITGTFTAGQGKITGNQEFHFSPRGRVERNADQSRITGEGKVEGRAISGSAWNQQLNVTGTEGHIASERNPSERAGRPAGFANSATFKGKGNHAAPTQHVTGVVGWSAQTGARVTLSGGARG